MSTNNELKEAYKQLKFQAGVFQIRNIANGKIFIGSNTNLDKIWNRMAFELNFGSHKNVELQADWKTFGESNFVYEIVSVIEEKEGSVLDLNKEIKTLEAMFIEELQPFGEKGYNRAIKK